MDKKMNEITAENKILKESLKTAREELEKLRKQVRMIDVHSQKNYELV